MKSIKILLPIFLILTLFISGCNNKDQNANGNDTNNGNVSTNDNGDVSQDDTAQDQNTGDNTADQNNNDDEDTPIKSSDQPENKVFNVTAPLMHEHVGSTFKVEGQAQVYEGKFQYRIEDQAGKVIVKDQVTIEGKSDESDGDSLWRDFNFQVDLKDNKLGEGNLVLYTVSQTDDKPENELIIPLDFSHE